MGEAKRRKERIFRTQRLRVNYCLNCGKKIDSATNTKPGELIDVHPGALAICISCHHIMAYADDLSFREITDEEIVDIAGRPELVIPMNALALARVQYNRMKKEKGG